MKNGQQRRIILVDEYNNLFAGTLVDTLHEFLKTRCQIISRFHHAIGFLHRGQRGIDTILKILYSAFLNVAQVKVQHRVLLPLLLQLLDGETLEQVFAAGEVGF